jgi:predicted phosphodiesterase
MPQPPLEEPIRIISDIHFGHPACIVDKIENLAPLFRGAGTVIFNGDSVEMRFLKGRQIGQKNAQALKQLCSDEGAQAVFLNGNHDPILSSDSHLDLVDGAVLVTHGDLLFHDVSPWSQEAEIIGEAHTEELEKLDDDAFYDFEKRLKASKRAALAVELHKPNIPRGPLASVATVLRECWPPWRPMQIIWCWIVTPEKAEALARVFRPRARIIIIGHTHYSGIWKRGPRTIINTGSFLSIIGGRKLVEIHGDRVTLRKIEHEGETFTMGDVIETFTATKLKPLDGY